MTIFKGKASMSEVYRRFTEWENGADNSIREMMLQKASKFISEYSEEKSEYNEQNWKVKTPTHAAGIVAWWLLFRDDKDIQDIYKDYYQMRLQQYKDNFQKENDDTGEYTEDGFLSEYCLKLENKLLKELDIYKFVFKKGGKQIRAIINNYFYYIQSKKLLKHTTQHMQPEKLLKLEYQILDILCLHGKEIDSNLKDPKQIYDFPELNYYTESEIREASIDMQIKGWITCFIDDTKNADLGPAYWHKLLDEGKIALRNYLETNMQEVIEDKPLNSNLSSMQLPEEINTPRARKYFQKAMEKNWLVIENDHYVWKGFGQYAIKSKLAYFCGKIFKYEHSVSGNKGDSFPGHILEILFSTKSLYSSLVQVYNANKKQTWRDIIDNIFED